MKKMKLAVAVAAFAASLGFTSCLDSSGVGGTGTIMGYPLRVTYDYSSMNQVFEDGVGTKYIPTTEVTIEGNKSDLAAVSFSYDYEQWSTQGDRKSITLLATPQYIPYGNVTFGTLPESGTVSLSVDDRRCFIWGFNEYLILNPIFNIKKGTTNDNLEGELSNHHFTLYYDRNKAEDSGVMTLKLRYQITGVDSEESLKKDYTEPYSYYSLYFDLRNAVQEYETVNDTYPTKLVVEYETSSSGIPSMENKDTGQLRLDMQPKKDGEI